MAGHIVVGIDGSDDSRRALDWAFDEAQRRGATLVLVHAWEYPLTYEVVPPDMEQTHAEILHEEAVRVLNRGVAVKTELIQRRAASALVRASADAELLVVGSRGRSPMLRTLLGSVSTACVHHAKCPVVVVRAEPSDIDDRASEEPAEVDSDVGPAEAEAYQH